MPPQQDRIELGLRDRKKREMRRAIVKAAIRLCTERGVDAVTIEDIAAAVDMSPRSFYRYFATKEDALLSDNDERLRALRANLASRPVDEPILESVRAAVLAVERRYEVESFEDGQLAARARLLVQSPEVMARSLGRLSGWEQAITDAVATRLGVDSSKDLRPRVLAASTVGALRVALMSWVESEGSASLHKLMADALALVGSGGDGQVGTKDAIRANSIDAPTPTRRLRGNAI